MPNIDPSVSPFPPVPPIFELVPEDIVTVANRSLDNTTTPRCQATGIPNPEITWVGPNGEEFGGAPTFGVLRRDDAGVYACVATSAAGVSRAEFTITVEGTLMCNIIQELDLQVASPQCTLL